MVSDILTENALFWWRYQAQQSTGEKSKGMKPPLQTGPRYLVIMHKDWKIYI